MVTSTATKLGSHAVVVGASMGGMLAARVLADSYDAVTVVERDELPLDPANRRGVPQGRQVHVLLARCSQILDELFPGFLDELVACGVPTWDDGDLSKLDVSVAGHRLTRSGRVRQPMTNYYPSRPSLECQVRRRLRATPGVTILDGHDLVALASTPRHDRVTGVRVADRSHGFEGSHGSGSLLSADLVVDATGRGSRTPAFLESLGYGRPREDELVVSLAYASQPLHIPRGRLAEGLVVVSPEPGRPTTMALVGYENDTWMLTVGSMMGRKPPSHFNEMCSFVEDFAPTDALAAVRAAERLGRVVHHRVPSNRWRRYDKMRRTPKGLLVTGDAICSFNPIYGQGMTVAALDAIALRDCLRRGDDDLPRRFFRATARKIAIAWQLAVGSDLTLPEVLGPRPLSMRMTNAYVERLLSAAETDPFVAERFLRVTGMIDPPTRLLDPSLVAHVTRANRRRATTRRSTKPAGAARETVPR